MICQSSEGMKTTWRELGEDAYWFPNLSTDGTEWSMLEKVGNAESRRISFSRGLKRLCWQARLPYKPPHKLRNGHGVFGVKATKTIEEFKAFSQNMMHENMEITDRLYGRLGLDDVKRVVSGLKISNKEDESDEDILREFLKFKRQKDRY